MTAPRTGQAPPVLKRKEFRLKFLRSFMDPAFGEVKDALSQVEDVAWSNYIKGNKAPITVKIGRAHV